MCFSAGASFTSSTILAGIGTVTLTKVHAKKEILFAGIPLLFAFHQFNEGLLWLALTKVAFLEFQHWFTLSFLIVAHCFWPIYMPLSIYLIEPQAKRKKILFLFVILGTGLSLYFLSFLVLGACSASIVHCSIYYNFYIPGRGLNVLYFLATMVPFLSSSYPLIMIIGVINIIFRQVAIVIFNHAFVSVWCFFAAALSVMIYFFFTSLHPKLREFSNLNSYPYQGRQ